MTCDLAALTYDAHDPQALAQFWAGILGRTVSQDEREGAALLAPVEDGGFAIRFRRSPQDKVVPNRIHFDLTSESDEAQDAMVARALGLGARHIDIGQLPEEGHVVLADPDGNEFDVLEAGNDFLAGCGLIGALCGDGTQAVGYFWAEALGWPLVWDQDEETAIQSPLGGSKVTWGGPPVADKDGKSRVHLDLVAAAGSDQATEVERLLGLGATRVDIGQGDVDWVVLADPDDNEFCVLR